jgi:acylphosphatase
MATLRLHLVIRGTVQGVMFRESLRREAERKGVAGWTRNLADGRVEAVLEGSEAAVQAVEEWCHRGPPDAVVQGVEARSEAPQHETGFRVLR